MSEAVAPSLSTYQDEQTFSFQKHGAKTHQRPYLGPGWDEPSLLHDKIREYYSIDELIDFLKQDNDNGMKKYKKITLQFPDALVADSAIIVQQLQEGLKVAHVHDHHDHHEETEINFTEKLKKDKKDKKDHCTKSCSNCKCSDPLDTKQQNDTLPQEVWILADTAYSACCIDEVAAEHVGAEIVIHFGDACLNAIQKLDAVYVFGKPYLDIDTTVQKFKETYSDKEAKVVIMADTPHTHYMYPIYKQLKEDGYTNVAFADIDLERANTATIIGFKTCDAISKGTRFSNRLLKGINSEEFDIETDLMDYDLFHITQPQPPHLLFLTTKFSTLTIYDPSSNTTSQGPFPSLMKRYRYMQMARTSGTVGILVNTLSLRNTTEMIKTVSRKIREADKKSYMFVVGKPNVAKLANFESIEVWCILGCGQGGIILDQTNEFYKPIITPYELEMALSPQVTWTGKWVTEFERLIADDNDNDNNESDEQETTASSDVPQSPTLEGEDEAPEFNPVTGKFVSTSRPLRNIQHLEIDSASASANEDGQLVKAFSQAVAIKGTVSTSAVYLQNREWTGLGSDFAGQEDVDEEGALVEEGRGGIARGYDYDMSNRKE